MAAPVAAASAVAPAPVTNGAAPVNGTTPAPGVTTPEIPAVKAPEAYRFKKALKVNGKEIPVDLDEAGLTRELQVGRHSQAQLEQARAQLEQQAQFDRLIASGRHEEAFRLKGIDIEAAIAARAQRNAQRAELTPEQQENLDLREQLAEHQRRTEAEATERAEQTKTQRRQQVQAETRAELFEALDVGGFKLGPNVSKQVRGQALAAAARIQKAAMMAKQPKLTPEQLVAAVHKQFFGEQQRMTAALAESPDFRTKHGKELSGHFEALTTGLEGEALLSFVGPGFEQRFVQAQLARLASAGGNGAPPVALTPSDATPLRPSTDKTQSLDYWEKKAALDRQRGW